MTGVITLLCFIVLCLQISQGKVASGTLQLDSMNTEQYVTKFSFDADSPGTLTAKFTTHDVDYFDNHRHELRLALFGEEDWAKFLRMVEEGSLCRDRVILASWSKKISPQQRNVKDKFKTYTLQYPIKVKNDAHYTFFVLFDCYLEFYDAHPPKFDFEITLLNNGSHLPADETNMPTIQLVLLLLLLGFGAAYLSLMLKQFRTAGTVHLIGIFLGVAYIFQTISVLFEWLHLIQYAADGKGLRFRHTWFALDFFSEMLQGLAELVISFTLIALAAGWTLTTDVGLGGTEESAPGNGKLKGLAVMKNPLSILKGKTLGATLFFVTLLLTQITLELLGRRYEEDFNSFHDHEHWPGMVLMGMRCVLAAIFGVGITATIQTAPRDEPVTKFLRFLRIVGLLWFLSFPMVVVLSLYVHPTNRHTLVTFGAIAGQSCMLGGMLFSFLTGSSEYVKVSSVGRMQEVSDMFGSAMKQGSGIVGNVGKGLGKGFIKKVATD